MDEGKETALVGWINVMVYDADLQSVAEVKEKSTILLEILKRIDPEITVSVGDFVKNVNSVCQYVKNLFNPDVVDSEEILRGNQVETGKLLCLMLELALTGPNNMESIKNIQSLSPDVQTNIMVLTTLVSENSGKTNLSDIMKNALKRSVREESPVKKVFSPTQASPVKSLQTFSNSPDGRFDISSENTSPLAAFASSPQALYRRVMVENTKLRQKVRHSELFLKRRSQFDEQLTLDVETEHKEVIEENKELVKEQEQLKEKVHSLEENVNKLKEEIEFLQLEVQSKDKEIAEQVNARKDATAKATQLQDNRGSDFDDKLIIKTRQYEEEVEKNKNLTLQTNQAEQQITDLKLELVQVKEELSSINTEMLKRKADYADQVAHLQEELRRLERQKTRPDDAPESLAATLQRDQEISALSEKNAKLCLAISVNETTIKNMTKDMDMQKKQWKKERIELQDEVARLKKELDQERSKSSDMSESNKVQTKQYMDQISSLLKQVENHNVHNKSLNEKINNADSKCRQLEMQIEKFENSEQKVIEQITDQKSQLKEEKEIVKKIKVNLQEQKKLNEDLKNNNKELESHSNKLQKEISRLSPFEDQCKQLIQQCNGLKQLKEQDSEKFSKLSEELEKKLVEKENKCNDLGNSARKSREEDEMRENELKIAQEQLDTIQQNYEVLLQENKSSNDNLTANMKQIEELREELEKKTRYCKEKDNLLAGMRQKHEQEVDSHKEKLLALRGELDQHQKLVKELETKLETERTEQTTSESYQQKTLQLQQELETKQTHVERHSKQITILLQQITQQDTQLQQQNVQIEQQNQQLQQQNSYLQEEREKIKELQKNLSSEKKLATALNEKISILETSVREQASGETESASFKQLLHDANTKTKQCEEKIESLEEVKKSLIDTCNRATNNLADEVREKEGILEELSIKDDTISELKDRCAEEVTTSQRLSANNRSLEAQLQSSEALLRDLRKENAELQDKEEASRPSSRSSRRQAKTYEKVDLTSDSDAGSALHINELQTTASKAEEIFQRSRRSNAHARDILMLPTTKEEDSSDCEDNFTRTYSLRNTSDRRRSFQPRRYMGGRTPPRRRTLMGQPMQTQMTAFSTDVEEEPDFMDDMAWNRISSLQNEEVSEEEKNRLAELQRRNTLCLPHLKSSYPLEAEVSKKDEVPVDLISGTTGKRKKLEDEDAPRGTFKKWKTDHSLRSTSDLSQMMRTTQSDSNIRNLKSQPRVEIAPIEIKKPLAQSCAFEITMEPPKKTRMPRSKASGNLTGKQTAVKATKESNVTGRTRSSPRQPVKAKIETAPVTTRTKPVEEKAKSQASVISGARFTRSESKRSSISRATRKIAANLRAKKAK